MTAGQRDLVVLVADKNMEGALRGLLSRPQALGLKEFSHELYVHPERDPGCFHRGHDFLKSFALRFAHSLVVFDREGCGQEAIERLVLETQVEARLSSAGWKDRAAAVVIDPELEIWVWNDSPHVETVLEWDPKGLPLKDWLRQKGWLEAGRRKPTHPKAAVEEALRLARKPRSSAIYHQLAQRVSVERCEDPSFLKLREVLARWFSPPL
ncbi:MAG TPA: hypothetical protein DD490_28610 [Acidobacteria bacterium]|nr:hypothetical protein [Acidobacteriota bacterium]